MIVGLGVGFATIGCPGAEGRLGSRLGAARTAGRSSRIRTRIRGWAAIRTRARARARALELGLGLSSNSGSASRLGSASDSARPRPGLGLGGGRAQAVDRRRCARDVGDGVGGRRVGSEVPEVAGLGDLLGDGRVGLGGFLAGRLGSGLVVAGSIARCRRSAPSARSDRPVRSAPASRAAHRLPSSVRRSSICSPPCGSAGWSPEANAGNGARGAGGGGAGGGARGRFRATPGCVGAAGVDAESSERGVSGSGSV